MWPDGDPPRKRARHWSEPFEGPWRRWDTFMLLVTMLVAQMWIWWCLMLYEAVWVVDRVAYAGDPDTYDGGSPLR